MSRSGPLRGSWMLRSDPLRGLLGIMFWSVERFLGVAILSVENFRVSRSGLFPKPKFPKPRCSTLDRMVPLRPKQKLIANCCSFAWLDLACWAYGA